MLPPEAERKQIEITQKMSGESRLKIALDLSNLTRKIMEDGIKDQHPGITSKEFYEQISLRIGK